MSHNLLEQARFDDRPNYDLIQTSGWAVTAAHGEYCIVFRGAEEVVLAWRNGQWRAVGSRQGAFPGA